MATITDEISVPFPDAADLYLKFAVGACKFNLVPGTGAEWVSGTYSHPEDMLNAKIEQTGGTVRISQESFIEGALSAIGAPPAFDLALGAAQPYRLKLEGGASDSTFDLGGLPITRLDISQGAGRFDFTFSAPNPEVMSVLDLDAGAVGLEMRNLCNANFSEMNADGGAASYKFDFGGALQRDARVKINTGAAAVEIIIPSTTAAKIIRQGALSAVDVGDGFTKKGSEYLTAAALAGEGALLTIEANVSVGALLLRTV